MTDLPAGRLGVPHAHVFLGEGHRRNERRTWLVIALTSAMMVGEIVAGSAFGSIALIADGWHMATHAAAMLITALAYVFARRHAADRRFTFGTGKLGDLAAFASAIVLALIALMIGWESLLRFYAPRPIDFGQAIAVAVLGLAVNLVSAWLLREEDHGHHHHGHHAAHDHPHDHDHSHDHPHPHEHPPGAARERGRDNNLRAAYMHVLADALTSVLAIGALAAGATYGWLWLDPAVGIVGALVIARWSYGLMRDAGAVLIDYRPAGEALSGEIRDAIEDPVTEIADLHVWQLGPGHHGAILSILSDRPQAPSAYRARLAGIEALSHVTIEVEKRAA